MQNVAGLPKMPEDTVAAEAAPAILQNARVKQPPKSKGVAKSRKARPLKNLEHGVLHGRMLELQKRVRTAECKMTLLKEKLVVHEDEAAARSDTLNEAVDKDATAA